MTRIEFVRRLVLNEICDDYEDLEMVNKWVFKTSARCGLTVTQSDVIKSLIVLIESGMAKAYRFEPMAKGPNEVNGPLQLDEIQKFYFWATQQGIDLQVSDGSWWPFDDNDELRKDWVPPDR
jgi:hypothetical protein